MSYPRHKFIPSGVESIQLLLNQLIQNTSIHQGLGKFSDLVPVVFWVLQKNLDALHVQTERNKRNYQSEDQLIDPQFLHIEVSLGEIVNTELPAFTGMIRESA